MKIILFLMTILFCTSCNLQKKEKQAIRKHTIEKIVFSEINTAAPLNSELFKKKVILFSLDSIALIEKTYKKKELIERNKIKSYHNSNKILFTDIPEKYLTTKKYPYLNYYPENDGEYINIDIYINNGNVISWTLSFKEKDLPQELELVYENYIISKNKLL